MAVKKQSSLIKKVARDVAKFGINSTQPRDIEYFISTGSIIVDIAIAGRVDGGVPNSLITMFAGKPSSGKTLLATGVAKHAQQDEITPIWFDSENAVQKKSMANLGVDMDDMLYFLQSSITHEDKAKSLTYTSNQIAKSIIQDGGKAVFIYDSLGKWVSNRTLTNIEKNNTSKDMSISMEKKALVGNLVDIGAETNCPIVLINHTYANIGGYGASTVVSGGGVLYMPSVVLEVTSKATWKTDDTNKDTIGNIMTCGVVKGRLTREGTKVKFGVHRKYGIIKYYGLETLGLSYGLILSTKEGTSTVYQLASNPELKIKKKHLHTDPKDETYNKFFETLISDDTFKECVSKEFLYG